MGGPHERLIEEYAEFLHEVRGFARSTTGHHRSTVIEFLTRATEPTHPIDALSVTHVERYLSMKATEVTRQTLQHTVAHLRAFLRYGFERGHIRERLDRIDTPRAYRGELPAPRPAPSCTPRAPSPCSRTQTEVGHARSSLPQVTLRTEDLLWRSPAPAAPTTPSRRADHPGTRKE